MDHSASLEERIQYGTEPEIKGMEEKKVTKKESKAEKVFFV